VSGFDVLMGIITTNWQVDITIQGLHAMTDMRPFLLFAIVGTG
jgi:hypothetical protein